MTSPETLALIRSAEELMEQMDREDRERMERLERIVAAAKAFVEAEPHPTPLNDEAAEAWDALKWLLSSEEPAV